MFEKQNWRVVCITEHSIIETAFVFYWCYAFWPNNIYQFSLRQHLLCLIFLSFDMFPFPYTKLCVFNLSFHSHSLCRVYLSVFVYHSFELCARCWWCINVFTCVVTLALAALSLSLSLSLLRCPLFVRKTVIFSFVQIPDVILQNLFSVHFFTQINK